MSIIKDQIKVEAFRIGYIAYKDAINVVPNDSLNAWQIAHRSVCEQLMKYNASLESRRNRL